MRIFRRYINSRTHFCERFRIIFELVRAGELHKPNLYGASSRQMFDSDAYYFIRGFIRSVVYQSRYIENSK